MILTPPKSEKKFVVKIVPEIEPSQIIDVLHIRSPSQYLAGFQK
jgi:hypothetical protein